MINIPAYLLTDAQVVELLKAWKAVKNNPELEWFKDEEDEYNKLAFVADMREIA